MAPLVPLNLGPRGPLLVAQNRPVAKSAPKNNGKDRPWQSEFPRDSPVQGTSVLLEPLWPAATASPFFTRCKSNNYTMRLGNN